MPFHHQVACVGELLIDFVCSDIGADLMQGDHFIKKAGGAPANVACAISRLGGRARLAAKVGNDSFGTFLINTVKAENVNVDSVIVDKNQTTTLAFVALKPDGAREFSFNWGAHDTLTYEEISEDFVTSSAILHLGAALTDGNIVTLYRQLIISGKNLNKLISFDPNFRRALWAENEETQFIRLCHEFIAGSDILKVSEEEAIMISGNNELQQAVKTLHALGAKMVLITLGHRGTLLSFNGHVETIDSVYVDAIDSTGAGDAFIGAMLFQISLSAQLPANGAQAAEMVHFANRVGAITCTRIGAIKALPYLNEVNEIQVSTKR